jgi:hypothetical protein
MAIETCRKERASDSKRKESCIQTTVARCTEVSIIFELELVNREAFYVNIVRLFLLGLRLQNWPLTSRFVGALAKNSGHVSLRIKHRPHAVSQWNTP